MADWSGRPAYLQVADDLRASILKGRFAPGSQLPSYGTLMKQYGVSITVVRSAIRELSNESLIRTHQGKGVFVSDPLPEMKHNDSGSQLTGKGERVDGLRDEVTDLKETVAVLQAQLINLYEITGHAYPPETIPAGWRTQAAEG